MRRREYVHPHKRKHISNRHLADRYFYAGEHDTVTRISLTQYNADTLHTREIKTNETRSENLSTEIVSTGSRLAV